jgi:hypothetical protein
LSALQSHLTQLQQSTSQLFAHMREHPYKLFATLVHDGRDASSGHYVCFVRSSASTDANATITTSSGSSSSDMQTESSNKPNATPVASWHKYNDAVVKPVELDEVFSESRGAHATHHASAYFLIYVEQQLLDSAASAKQEQSANDTMLDSSSINHPLEPARLELMRLNPFLVMECDKDNAEFTAEQLTWEEQHRPKDNKPKSPSKAITS